MGFYFLVNFWSTAYSTVQDQQTLRVLTFIGSQLLVFQSLSLTLQGVKARFAGNSDSGARREKIIELEPYSITIY